MTIGVEFGAKIIKLKDKVIKIQIWDTVNSSSTKPNPSKAGAESFKSVTRSYYKSTCGIIVVFDVTNRKSFENIEDWIDEARETAH